MIPPSVKRRATKLLFQYLIPEQQADWRAHRSISVRGSNGALYRLTPAYIGANVAVLKSPPESRIAPGLRWCPPGAPWWLPRDEEVVLGLGIWPRPTRNSFTAWPGELTSDAQLPDADIALALLLHLHADARWVDKIACSMPFRLRDIERIYPRSMFGNPRVRLLFPHDYAGAI
jgi:hypothetical protein